MSTSSTYTSFGISVGYGHSDADVLHQSLLEANIATEVCLTILDTLSLFTMAFKVCSWLGVKISHNNLSEKIFFKKIFLKLYLYFII